MEPHAQTTAEKQGENRRKELGRDSNYSSETPKLQPCSACGLTTHVHGNALEHEAVRQLILNSLGVQISEVVSSDLIISAE